MNAASTWVGAFDRMGHPIRLGDTVQVACVDSSRGAQLWMHRGEVVGFGRTRVQIKFPSRGEVCAVGGECLRVVGVL